MYCTETDKIRGRVMPFVGAKVGLDLGCRDVKVNEHAIGIDSWEGSKSAVIKGDASDLGKLVPKGATYDYVFSSHLLEHINKPPTEVVKHWLSFVKTGGFLILYLPDINYYKEKNPKHIYNLTGKQWLELLSKENIIVYEERNPDTGFPEEYSVLIVIQKNG